MLFILNSHLLTDLLSVIGKCPQCLAFIDVNHLLSKKQGLSDLLSILGIKCGWSFDFWTRREINCQGSGINLHEVNVQAVMGCHGGGLGQKVLATFCSIMNNPEPTKYLAY